MSYPRRSMLILPYARLELPGWGHLLRSAGVYRNELWSCASVRRIHGKLHGFLMDLDLSNWSERQTYFLGRFYDLPSQLLLKACLRPGETFVDIGANIGMLTLLGAHCIGPTGRVVAVEPNPIAFSRLKSAVDCNALGAFVTMHQVGLSDEVGTLDLRVVSQHSGCGTFADIPADECHLITQVHQVSVTTGDDLITNLPPEGLLIKIDVEGFEMRVLRGLARTLEQLGPTVVAEVIPNHLQRAGTSLAELMTFMAGFGLRPYELDTERGIFRHRLRLRPLNHSEAPASNNVVWIRPHSTHASRLASAMH